MKRFFIAALALAIVTAFPSHALAAPSPAPSPAAAAAQPSPSPQTDLAMQIGGAVRQLENAYVATQREYQAFALSVYEPFCKPYGGLLLNGDKDHPPVSIAPGRAWPAVVRCKNGTVLNQAGP